MRVILHMTNGDKLAMSEKISETILENFANNSNYALEDNSTIVINRENSDEIERIIYGRHVVHIQVVRGDVKW